MAGLTNSCDGFAYRIERTEKGGYVLHITNATAILVRNAENGDVGVDLSLCPAIHCMPFGQTVVCPNSQIFRAQKRNPLKCCWQQHFKWGNNPLERLLFYFKLKQIRNI